MQHDGAIQPHHIPGDDNMAKSTIRKDRAIRWTVQEDGNTVSYVGLVKTITPTHYLIDIAGMGEVEVDRTDGTFEVCSMIEYREATSDATPVQTDEPQPNTTDDSATPDTTAVRQGRSKTNKVFSAAAITLRDGKYKLRFSTDAKRYGHALGKAGHKEIVITDLPPGNKVQLAGELMTHPMFQYPIAQEVISEFLVANM